jgi:NitT/TauT family transport system substrate-binding protein
MRLDLRVPKMLLFGLALVIACAGQPVPPASMALAQTPEVPTAAKAPLPDLGTLKVGYLPSLGYAPVFVALDKGYFKDQGLAVELQSFRSGSAMIPFLGTGDLDVGAGETGTALFNAVAQGLDVRAAAALASQPPGHGSQPLLVRKDLFDSGKVSRPADLKGKKVAINVERGVVEYLLYEALAQGGLTLKDVEVVTLPFPDMPAALANKAIDAAVALEPTATQAMEQGSAVVLIPGDKIVDTPQNGVVYFGKRLLDPANREAAVRFLVAYLQGVRDLYGDGWRDEANADIISRHTKVPPPIISKAIAPYCDPNGAINTASTEKIQNYLVRRGYTEFAEPLPLSQVITDTFRSEAVQRLGQFATQ